MHSKRSLPALLLGLLMALSLSLGALAGTLWVMGTTAPLLEAGLNWEAAPELTEADRAPVARLIADTMAGRERDFRYKGLFSEQARVHMADCAPLFRLARAVGLAGFGLFFAALLGCLLLRDWRSSGRGMLIGAGIPLAILLALGLWGLMDFDSLFTAFHRAAFSNSLWLFPAEDLLIRLMPLSFFVGCAARAGGLWLACTGALICLGALLMKKHGKKTEA